MKKRPVPAFECFLEKQERVLGFCFLAVHILLTPLLKNLMKEFLPGALSDAQWTTLYYLVSFLLILLFLRSLLFRDWDRFCDFKLPCLLAMIPTHLVYVGLSLIGAVLLLLLPEELFELYDGFLTEYLTMHSRSMLVPLVLLSPIAEEVLFRGVLFGTLRVKNRAVAYFVSVGLCVACSVVPYAVNHPDATAVFYMLQQLPFVFALTWCYERVGTVWSPALYHALFNLVTVLMQG